MPASARRAVRDSIKACCSCIALTKEGINSSWFMFKYSMPSRFGRDCFTVRVPVPGGQEEAAKKIAEEIGAAHLKNIIK